ncbi:MAG: prolyl-tRNA synthetase associated domain-containing protein [Clostridia bacterium]|nr:prolyl-tRNA synthetase associated domain-containing protein [Clostridia bacterium]
MSNKALVLSRLDSLGVPHDIYEHPAAHTMEDCLALPFAAPDVTICKNILLCNRQKTMFYLYVTLADKPFRTADVSKLLGVSRLSFAPEEALMDMVQTASGSLCPMALWFDAEHRITFVADKDIKATARIAFHPCDNTATVVYNQQDFWEKVAPTFGTAPIWLDVPWPEMKGEAK